MTELKKLNQKVLTKVKKKTGCELTQIVREKKIKLQQLFLVGCANTYTFLMH